MNNNFVYKLASTRYLSFKLILSFDTVLSVASSFAVCILSRFLFNSSFAAQNTVQVIICSGLLSVVSFVLFGTYKNIIRHSTIRELFCIGMASLVKASLLWILVFSAVSINARLAVTLGVIDFLFTSMTLFSIRIAMVLVYEIAVMKVSTRGSNVLVYGIGNSSVSTADMLSENSSYKVVGFYQYGNRYKYYKLKGVPLFYFRNQKDFEIIRKRFDIKGIVFPSYNSVKEEYSRLVNYCVESRTRMFVSPPVDEFSGESPLRRQIRAIRIEDLLGREEISVNETEVSGYFSGKSVLVTGAAGSIGSELCRQLAALNVGTLIVLDFAETPLHNIRLELEEKFPSLNFIPIIGDVRNKNRMEMVFARHKPQVVFHAAAYKHVPLMEENPCEAAHVNVVGTRNVADMCVKHDVEKMIMISTDKAVNPTNVMGASKRMAEIYVQSLGLAIEHGTIEGITKFVTTRFGNVLGSNGSVIPRFREQIENGGPVTVTHPDITRFFMTIPEACLLVMEAAYMSNGNDIFVFEMGESVKIVDLARRMISLAGYEPDVDIKIEFTGLRPGEKLYEEVLSDEENTIPTQNKKIMIARVRQYEYHDIVEYVELLVKSINEVNVYELVKALKRVIPEYISQNSKFEMLDSWSEQESEVETAINTTGKSSTISGIRVRKPVLFS